MANEELIEKLRKRDLESGGDPETFDERREAARRDVARILATAESETIQLTAEDLDLLESL